MRTHSKLKVAPNSVMSLIFPLIREEKTEGPLKCKECKLGPWSRTYAGYCKLCFNEWCIELDQAASRIK
jgi:hypothetical protein